MTFDTNGTIDPRLAVYKTVDIHDRTVLNYKRLFDKAGYYCSDAGSNDDALNDPANNRIIFGDHCFTGALKLFARLRTRETPGKFGTRDMLHAYHTALNDQGFAVGQSSCRTLAEAYLRRRSTKMPVGRATETGGAPVAPER